MKRGKFTKLLALIMSLCLCMSFTLPVAAGTTSAYGETRQISASWTSFWDRIFGNKKGSSSQITEDKT